MSCCDPRGCDRMFGPRFARHLARRYDKRGLDGTARRMVRFVEQFGIQDASVLEIGGGVGDIQVELLMRGAGHATNLELSTAYDEEAARLARAAGVADRVTRRVVDLAAQPEAVEPADVVILHRVVCCYPDADRLLAAAAGRARRLLVFSHPPRNVVSRVGFTVQNGVFALVGREFRAFTHRPEQMVSTLEAGGLAVRDREHGPWWRVVGLERIRAA